MTVALVTGASRGIGRATALALGQAGFSVACVARTEKGLAETEALVRERGGQALAVLADVGNSEAVRSAIAAVEETLGPISALVNNAGSLRAIGPLWEVDPDDWWADVRTSLGGTYVVCREVVPRLIERREGRIVNVASYVAVRPSPYQTAYAAAKAGVLSLTEALAASLEPYGIVAFAVAPGYTETELTKNLISSAAGRRWLPEVGTGRIVEAERSAQLIVALARGDADPLSGRVLHTLDDVGELLREIDAVRREELYVPRVRRLRDG